jgi:UDP-N-acetylmuramate: L-alanyl-gamma-D-glutamyl-meso-diaminopimelate ligase
MMPVDLLKGEKRVHFSGIGGVAMAAGARLAVEAGWEVRGSDNSLYPPAADMVQALGVPVAARYDARNLEWNPSLVVIGNALSRANPEVECALEHKMHYVSLPEWLKEAVLRMRRPIVVAGTHGKTTTTALTAFLLDRSGLAPGFLIGGQPLDFAHSARLGPEGGPFVIEGDEYDTAFFDKRAKFLHYLPEIAVVTSVEFDHGDIYRDLDEIELAFQRMLRLIPRTGTLILCADDQGAMRLREHALSSVVTYGFSDDADWRGEVVGAGEGLQRLQIHRKGQGLWAELDVPLVGRHNLQNALAAVVVADGLGVSPEVVSRVLPQFHGVRRRMEVFLEARGLTFVDDFAHHPTAVRETIRAARSRWPQARLRVVFEPRSNTTVTNRFQQDLRAAFREADEVWLGPVYRVERIPERERLDREALARDLAGDGVAARWSDHVEDIVAQVIADPRPGDVVLILSNGAFGGIYERFRDAWADGQGAGSMV